MPWGSETVPSYSSYKNDKFTRHLDKLKKQLRQIDDCSLKDDDKKKLKAKLIELLTTSKTEK